MVTTLLQAPRALSQSDLERALAESKRTKVSAKKPTIVSLRLDDYEVLNSTFRLNQNVYL